MRKIILYVFILPALIWLHACAVLPGPVCEEEEKTYCRTRGRFTGRWHDYYKRAISCMEGECYDAAISDLDEALKRRPGEKRWANTYGMHFMDYFPHRERGIAHYFTGNYQEAESELALSIRKEPSDKARFYLDKVRTRIMEEEILEPGRPDLRIIHPQAKTDGSDERWTRDDPVIISGWATDKRYVSEIILDGIRIFTEGSEQRVEFREELLMPPGRHEIRVFLRNLLGGEREERLIIRVDRSGPMIFTQEARASQIQGRVYDEAGLRSLVMDAGGKRTDIPMGADGSFVISLNPDMKAVLWATDALGNETRADIIAYPITRNRSSQALFAQNVTDIYRHSIPSRDDGPDILIKGWPGQETVFKKSVDIEGEVISQHHLEELSMERSSREDRVSQFIFQMPNFKSQALRPTFHASFNQSVSLNPGENRITVMVRDVSGNTERKVFLIIRKIPEALDPENRYTFKMCPFDDTDEWEQHISFLGGLFSKLPICWRGYPFMKPKTRAWFQFFLSERFSIRNRFQVMTQKELKRIFQEYQIPRNLSIISRKFHSLFLADTYKDGKGIEVIARLIDIRTSEIIAVKDVYGESEDRTELKAMAERLSEKFHRAFPLTRGMILNISKTRLKADFNMDKITKGWPMIIYREENQRYNPVTGKSLGADTKILVDALMGNDDIVIIGDGKLLRTGDRVITR